MSICRSTNGDKTSVGGARRVMGNGNGVFDQSLSSPIQNRGSPTTRNNIHKNIDVNRRMNSSNRKLHRLIFSHRSSRCDGGDDNKSTSSPGVKTILTSASNRAPPTPPPPPITTPQKQNRYSMMMAMMDHYSCSSSPVSAATPSTSESTISNSLRTPHSATSFSTFFSHSDYEDIEFDGIHDNGLGWIGDSDDEGSQTHMSAVSPLISKLLRSELKGRDDSHDEWDNDEKKMVSPMCKFVCSWSVSICIWILLFACSISIDSKSQYNDNEAFQDRNFQWINWDHVRYASSIFWTVGGDSFPEKDGPLLSTYHQIITCVFMTGSLGFMGLLLGEWGDSIIRNYEAVSFQKDGGAKSSLESQKCFVTERGRQSHYHRRSQRPIERGRNRPRHRAVTKGNNSDYGSLPLSSSKYNRHQWHDLSPLRFPDSSDDETDYGNRNKDGDDDNRFTLFPHMHWLLMQSLVLTTLSAICVTFIRYCEQNRYSIRSAVGVDKNDPRIGSEVDMGSSEDEWDVVSTIYYAVSTATTSGVKNALEPVSEDGKFFVLLFVPLSVITSLHWMVYIAQKRMQKSQRVRSEQKRRMLEGGEHKVFVEKYLEFDANAGREVVFVGSAKHHKPIGQQKDVANKENEDDNYVVRKPVVSISRKAGTESSLETFYELELQRMGLVDIETFRVLKRNYELKKGVKKLKETNV